MEAVLALIDVSQAQAGMVLAADILDKRGRVLIPTGAELKEKHLGALPAWGVTRIEVEGDDVEGSAEVEPWALEEADKELGGLFSATNRGHPAIDALYDVCKHRVAARIQASAAGEVS
jgi:hypothetical protein